MRQVRYHPKASHEALKSARFYDHKRPGLGMEFFSEVDAAVQAPQGNPSRPACDPNGIRSWRLHRFPFRVYYVIDPDTIRILAVAHLRRKPGYWRQRIIQS
jgi:toxin ParE1/3/4